MSISAVGRLQRAEGWLTLRRLGWMAFALAGVTAGLITYGSWVRVSGSGLGCPDWPLCNGGVLPGEERAAVIEYGHRMLAGVTMVLVAVVGLLAFRRRRETPVPALLLSAAALLIFIQAGLGGITVIADLPGAMRLAHLAIGMLILGLLTAGGLGILDASRLSPSPQPSPTGTGRGWRTRSPVVWMRLFPLVLIGAGTIMVGGSIVATQTSFGCLDLPLCDGDATTMATWLHTFHRALGLVLVAGVLATAIELKRRGGTRAMAVALGALATLAVAQVSVGAVSIAVELPDGLRVLHVALASLVWWSLVSLWVLSMASWRRRRGQED